MSNTKSETLEDHVYMQQVQPRHIDEPTFRPRGLATNAALQKHGSERKDNKGVLISILYHDSKTQLLHGRFVSEINGWPVF